MRPVYLDHNATTPVGAPARDAMAPYLAGQYGNPLTAHRFGEGPRAAVDDARAEVRALLGASADDSHVVFTSGASESLNTAIKGLAFAHLADAGGPATRPRIVFGAIEHDAVRRPALWLERFGFEAVAVAPDQRGVTSVERFLAEVDPQTTLLASLHFANNELGTVQPVEEIGRACRERGVPFVCDVVQGIGKLDVSAVAGIADLIALSAHKFYGPKGAGALLLRRGTVIEPLIHASQQEDGMRGGTHNVPGIAGLGAAAAAARVDAAEEGPRQAKLRDALWEQVSATIEGVHWNGDGAPLLPNTLNMSFDGCPSHLLCEQMDARGFAISAGAACRSGDVRPSRNLTAMGLPAERATTSVRASLGHDTTIHDVNSAAEAFVESVAMIRASV